MKKYSEEKEEMLKELRKIELERIEMDMYGGSREEYIKLCEKEKELKEKLYNADYREITNDEVKDFIRVGY
nr:MAG TPA: hypothetical protein [Caudoviricetes sp.]